MVQPPAYQPSFYILPILRGAGMLLFGWRQWLLTHTQETDSRQPAERTAWLQLLVNLAVPLRNAWSNGKLARKVSETGANCSTRENMMGIPCPDDASNEFACARGQTSSLGIFCAVDVGRRQLIQTTKIEAVARSCIASQDGVSPSRSYPCLKITRLIWILRMNSDGVRCMLVLPLATLTLWRIS